MGYLIDTCIWVDVERGALSPADVARFTGSDPVYISPVTIAELKFGVDSVADAGIRQKRQAALYRLKRKPILRIDETTGEIFGSLAAQLKTIGSQHRYRVQDLWIASQAIQYGMALLTYNEKDFADIPGLSLKIIGIQEKKKGKRIEERG
jgi:predicted nucleic acid-binding protein